MPPDISLGWVDAIYQINGGYRVMVVCVNVFVCIGGNVERVRYDDLYFDAFFLQKL